MKTNLASAPPRPGEATSFRLRLQAELARRCAGNPRYSLRAFARRLGVDHSTLSQLLRGRRALTRPAIERLGARLGLDAAAIETYAAREPLWSALPGGRLAEMQQLTRDAASLVSEWHHYAMLELVRLKSFRPDSRWVARVLGLTVDEVNVALQRLVRLGLLEMRGERWVDRSGDTTASLVEFGERAVERLFAQVSALAAAALREVPAGLREHSSTTLAVRSARVPEALERIARFRRELVAFLEEGGSERDDVYQIEIGFFPVTTIRKGGE